MRTPTCPSVCHINCHFPQLTQNLPDAIWSTWHLLKGRLFLLHTSSLAPDRQNINLRCLLYVTTSTLPPNHCGASLPCSRNTVFSLPIDLLYLKQLVNYLQDAGFALSSLPLSIGPQIASKPPWTVNGCRL